jgi:SAM-dependent methyltransferase
MPARRGARDTGVSGVKLYDLREEGRIVQRQLTTTPNPVVEARLTMSHAILAHVLLGLSDAGFYEYLSGRDSFAASDAVKALALDEFTFRSLLDYLVGCGALVVDEADDDVHRLTEKGRRYFNVYSRGVMNVYLGGYGSVLHKLGSVLKRQVALADPSLVRSTRHAAAGAAYSTCTFTIPDVFAAMDDKHAKVCLDLGCGTGDFLIQYVLRDETSRGIGIDISGDALEQARANAEAFGVADRLAFHEAAVGPHPLGVPAEALGEVEIVTSMYMLHEFGRNGREAIVDVIRSLKRELPGRLLLALEVEACEPAEFARQVPPAPHYGRLDYRLIHALSGQGLPRSQDDWHGIFEDAGCSVVERGIPTGGSLIYIAQM